MIKVPKRGRSQVRQEVTVDEARDPTVPSNFFNDTYLLPSFYMPENKQLLIQTHNNIRRSLFYDAFRDIKYTEYKRLAEDEDFFEFKHLENIENGRPPSHLIEYDHKLLYFNDHYLQPERNYRLLGCQKWTFDRNGISEGEYLIKFYHTDKDEFKPKVYPISWKDYFRLRLYKRKYFKVL